MRAFVATLALGGLVSACDSLPGKPTEAERPVLPTDVRDFATLYGTNCSGCHGADGRLGAARALNDPLYLTWAGDQQLRSVTANGVAGTAMPAFATSEGGVLTDQQIETLVAEMLARWGNSQETAGVRLPPYQAAPGNPDRGARAYGVFCARCHGPDGTGGEVSGSIVDGSYLALVSDQALRSVVVAGRGDLGMPDWRHALEGQPMTDQQIADVVGWLASKRVPFPGRLGPSEEGQDG